MTYHKAQKALAKVQQDNLKREIKAFLKDYKQGRVAVGSPYWLEYKQYIK